MPQSPPDEEARARLERVRAYAVEAGRDPAGIGFEARLRLGSVPEREWTAFVQGWRELGATHLCVSTMGMGLQTPVDHAAVLRDVLPLLKNG